MDLYSRFISLLLSCTTLSTVLQCQKVVIDHEVIGYQSHDVTLSCNYIHGSTKDKLTQVQWSWKNYSSEYYSMIIINNVQYGLDVPNTFLKDRVSFKINSNVTSDSSIIIKDVKMTDQGIYRCEYIVFPSGSEKGETILKVRQGKPTDLSTAATAGIVIIVLIIIILAAVGYLLLIKRRRAVCTSALYVTQNPGDFQQDEVTYADVKILKPGKVKRNTLLTEDTEYAAVSFNDSSRMTSRQASANQLAYGAHRAEHEYEYTQVKKDYNFRSTTGF